MVAVVAILVTLVAIARLFLLLTAWVAGRLLLLSWTAHSKVGGAHSLPALLLGSGENGGCPGGCSHEDVGVGLLQLGQHLLAVLRLRKAA